MFSKLELSVNIATVVLSRPRSAKSMVYKAIRQSRSSVALRIALLTLASGNQTREYHLLIRE